MTDRDLRITYLVTFGHQKMTNSHLRGGHCHWNQHMGGDARR